MTFTIHCHHNHVTAIRAQLVADCDLSQVLSLGKTIVCVAEGKDRLQGTFRLLCDRLQEGDVLSFTVSK